MAIDVGAFMPNMGVMLWVTVIGIVIMAIFVWFYLKIINKGDFLCDMTEERVGGGIVGLLTNYQIKVIKKKGMIEKWKILGTKIEPFEPKHKDDMIPFLDKKMDKVYLHRDKNGIIHVNKFELNEEGRVVMLPDYRDPMNFIVTEYDERAKIKEEQTKWKEFAPIIGSILAVGIVFLGIFFTLQYAEKQRTGITQAVDMGVNEVQSVVNQNRDVIMRAVNIVTNQEVLDRTSNWTTTIVR